MSSPYWIIKLDKKVQELMEEGIPPKQIYYRLSLTSIQVVYRSIRRIKCSIKNRNDKNRQTSINPIQPFKPNSM
jgi:hypothetical protein